MSADVELLDRMQQQLPISLAPYQVPAATGLVIVHEVNGFCTVGAGNLAPRQPDAQIAAMVERTNRLAHRFRTERRPVLAFLDTHEPDKPEPPYPPHCIRGSGEEELVPELAWMADDPDITLLHTDCINAFVGAMEPSYVKGHHGAMHNRCLDWVNAHRLTSLVTVGICTDICVLDFVATMLSARNHGLVPTLHDVVVFEPACATYDLPRETALALGLPATAAHPKLTAHHIGLYVMAGRGAVLANELG